MKRLSLISLMICFSLFIISCSEESSSDIVVAEKSALIDISASPIEVGEYSSETYTFTISNPFQATGTFLADNTTGITSIIEDYYGSTTEKTYENDSENMSGWAFVYLTYNGKQVNDISELDYEYTGNNWDTDLIILSSTCGTTTSSDGSYGTVPTTLKVGQSCSFTYKIAPKAAFMFKNRLAVEYVKYDVILDDDLDILTEEAMIEKAKNNGMYQLDETILKYAGKRSEYVYNNITYREASQGTEVDHIFSKTTGNLSDGSSYITETFEGGTDGSQHIIQFLDMGDATTSTSVLSLFLSHFTSSVSSLNLASSLISTLASGVSAKIDKNTALSTFYKYSFTSNNESCTATGLTNNTYVTNNTPDNLTINCDPGGTGTLSIGLNLGDDEYYKEKYLKHDKAYYRLDTYYAGETQNNLVVYLLLERKSDNAVDPDSGSALNGVADTDYEDNQDLLVRCWTNVTRQTQNGVQTDTLNGLLADPYYELSTEIFVKYENTYNSNGEVRSTAQDYVLVTGDCGGIEVETEYPLSYFNIYSDELSEVTSINTLEPYYPVETHYLDGIVRHNLIAQ